MARGTPDLIDVLKRHQHRGQGEINRYLDAVERLFGQIRRWMEPAGEQHLARVRDGGGTAISEADVGEYGAPTLVIDVGPNRVRFVPRGIHAEPGYRGRIDIDSGERVDLLVLDEDGVWAVLATRMPPSTRALTQREFTKLLAEILGASRTR